MYLQSNLIIITTEFLRKNQTNVLIRNEKVNPLSSEIYQKLLLPQTLRISNFFRYSNGDERDPEVLRNANTGWEENSFVTPTRIERVTLSLEG